MPKIKRVPDRHLPGHLLKGDGKPFRSTELKAAYKQRETILDAQNRPYWCARKSAAYLGISQRTLEDWYKYCPWLGRGIVTIDANCGTGRQDSYCLLEDLDDIREARSRTKHVPDIEGWTPIEDAANLIGIAETSLYRLCQEKEIEIKKELGKDSMGRAHERAYVPTKFAEDELSLRLGLKEGEISTIGAMKILGYETPERVLLHVRAGRLNAEKRPFPKGPDIKPGAGYVFNLEAVNRFHEQHPSRKEKSRRAQLEAEEFLTRQLRDGEWHLRKPILDAAADKGIHPKPIRAATKKLKVEIAFLDKKSGFGNRGPGYWRLPSASAANPNAVNGTTEVNGAKPARKRGGRQRDPEAEEVQKFCYEQLSGLAVTMIPSATVGEPPTATFAKNNAWVERKLVQILDEARKLFGVDRAPSEESNIRLYAVRFGDKYGLPQLPMKRIKS